MVMFVRSQNPFNLCNPWSKNYSLLFFGGTSVKSFYNPCNGDVRAEPKSVLSVKSVVGYISILGINNNG